jgi:hypothetical protein
VADLDRADAERILAAHGWALLAMSEDDGACLVRATATGQPGWIPPEVLRALDPDRPRLPSLVALRRVKRGLDRLPSYSSITLDRLAIMTHTDFETVLSKAWELGGEDAPESGR